MKNKLALIFLLALAVLLTACAPQATTAPAATEAPSIANTTSAPAATQVPTDVYSYGNQPAAQATATTASNPPSSAAAALALGPGGFLVDANGMTLYMLTSDPAGKSTCSGSCANNWPPLTVTGQPVAGTGVDASLLGTTTRADGSIQVTYNGHPLYLYKRDSAPGDKNGQGAGGVWYTISASGNAMK